MRENIEKQTAHENYQAWLERKVERARESMRAGRALDNEQVEAEFAALRNEAMKVAEFGFSGWSTLIANGHRCKTNRNKP